jgi:hypothetical protein
MRNARDRSTASSRRGEDSRLGDTADQRDTAADDREEVADDRERVADIREQIADQRDRIADQWESEPRRLKRDRL